MRWKTVMRRPRRWLPGSGVTLLGWRTIKRAMVDGVHSPWCRLHVFERWPSIFSGMVARGDETWRCEMRRGREGHADRLSTIISIRDGDRRRIELMHVISLRCFRRTSVRECIVLTGHRQCLRIWHWICRKRIGLVATTFSRRACDGLYHAFALLASAILTSISFSHWRKTSDLSSATIYYPSENRAESGYRTARN